MHVSPGFCTGDDGRRGLFLLYYCAESSLHHDGSCMGIQNLHKYSVVGMYVRRTYVLCFGGGEEEGGGGRDTKGRRTEQQQLVSCYEYLSCVKRPTRPRGV